MAAERPEIRFLHMTGKTGSRSVLVESDLTVLSQLQPYELYDSAVGVRGSLSHVLNLNQ